MVARLATVLIANLLFDFGVWFSRRQIRSPILTALLCHAISLFIFLRFDPEIKKGHYDVTWRFGRSTLTFEPVTGWASMAAISIAGIALFQQQSPVRGYADHTASNDKPGDIVRLSSIIRAVESAGQAVSYGINSTSWALFSVAAINLFLCLLGIFFAWFVVRKVGILSDGSLIYAPPMYANEEDRVQIAQEIDNAKLHAVTGTASGATDTKATPKILAK